MVQVLGCTPVIFYLFYEVYDYICILHTNFLFYHTLFVHSDIYSNHSVLATCFYSMVIVVLICNNLLMLTMIF